MKKIIKEEVKSILKEENRPDKSNLFDLENKINQILKDVVTKIMSEIAKMLIKMDKENDITINKQTK